MVNVWPLYESKSNLTEPGAAQRNPVNVSFFSYVLQTQCMSHTKILHAPPMCVNILLILAKKEILGKTVRVWQGYIFKDELRIRNSLRILDVDIRWGTQSHFPSKASCVFWFCFSICVRPEICIPFGRYPWVSRRSQLHGIGYGRVYFVS